MAKVSFEKYATLMNTIREIYVKHGAQLMYDLADWPTMNEYYASKSGETWFVFYWDGLSEIRTPDGSHPVLGSHIAGDNDATLAELKELFGLELLRTTERDHEKWDYYKATRNI